MNWSFGIVAFREAVTECSGSWVWRGCGEGPGVWTCCLDGKADLLAEMGVHWRAKSRIH